MEQHVFQTKSDYAYAVIKSDILAGKIAAGEHLVISKLAEHLNISFIPVRDALNRLAFEGLVDVGDNNRSVVSTISPKELRDTVELRIMLEPICSQLATPYVGSETISKLKKLIFEMENSIQTKEYDYMGSLNREFHMLIYSHCPNKKLVNIIEDLYKISIRARMIFQIQHGRCEEANWEHKQIVEALEDKNGQRVFQLVEMQKRAALQMFLEAIEVPS